MKETVKTNIITLIWFMVIAVSMSLTIKTIASENKGYSIDNAEFNISFTEDGDAYVEEIWTVTFQRGEFSRFYKEIYKKNLNDLEKFTSIEVINAYEANVCATTYEDKTLIEWKGDFKRTLA